MIFAVYLASLSVSVIFLASLCILVDLPGDIRCVPGDVRGSLPQSTAGVRHPQPDPDSELRHHHHAHHNSVWSPGW